MQSLALGARSALPPPKHYHETYVIEAVGGLVFLVVLAYFVGLLIWSLWARSRVKANGQDGSGVNPLWIGNPASLPKAGNIDEVHAGKEL